MRSLLIAGATLVACGPSASPVPVAPQPTPLAPTPVGTPAEPAPAPAPASFEQSGIADWSTPPPPTAEPAFDPPVARRMKLANGMALLVIENHALPIVSMTIVVPGGGSSNDPRGKSGLAAYTADLLDEGAGELSAISIAEEADRLGAGIGIYADVDAAYVSVSTLAKTLDPTLELVTKLITRPAFDDKEAERVKGDRVTALELRPDRPREVASIMLAGALYGRTTPYGHPTTGELAEVKALSVADARTFYRQRWSPRGMTLVVAGDVDPKALAAKLAGGLGAWKPAGAKAPGRPRATPAKISHRLLLADRPDAAQSDVRIGIVGIERKDRRYGAFEVFRTILGDGFTSRLNQRLREGLGITYGVGASMDWRLARGPFVIGTALVTPETARGISEALKIVADLGTTEVPAEELEKAKQNLIRALPAQFGTNEGTADAFAELALHRLPDDWYTRYAQMIRKITATEVKAVAKAAAPADKLVVTVVGDLAKIGAELDTLELGVPAMHDLHAAPRAPEPKQAEPR